MIRALARRLRADDGLTLQEMIVTFMLVSVVMIVVGGVYLSTVSVQQSVTGLTAATNEAQLVAQQIDRGVRNASELNVQTLASGDQIVRVRTVDSSEEGVWSCRAWYYDSSGEGAIRTRAVADGTYIANPTDDELAGWSLIVDGVVPASDGTIFAQGDPPFTDVLEVDFSTEGYDETGGARIKFSTPLMPGETKVETCL